MGLVASELSKDDEEKASEESSTVVSPTHAAKPGFDCAKAGTQVERLICSDAERKALSSERDSLTRILRDLHEMAGGAAEYPEDDKAAQELVASAFILQWKINRALYQQYGGRIIFQQGGPEPLDAYRKFLKEQEKQGAFEILKKEFELQFWRYYVADSIHSFYEAGSEEDAQAFANPWWLSIPHRGYLYK